MARAARAAELVDRTAGGDDRVTQFEALTAAAYSELARAGVEVAVIEAGLGGRYDATNVIPSRVQVLTSVGLEHTRWLGPTLTDIAGEKLDVVAAGGDTGARRGPGPEVRAVAERVAGERGARIVRAGHRPRGRGRARWAPSSGATSLSRSPPPRPTSASSSDGAVRAAAASRCGAGSPAGSRRGAADAARRRPQPGRHARRWPSRCRELAPAGASSPWSRSSTTRTRPRCWPRSAGLRCAGRDQQPESACAAAAHPAVARLPAGRPAGGDRAATRDRALARARELAGPGGVVVATGSIYLIADLLAPAGDRRASSL